MYRARSTEIMVNLAELSNPALTTLLEEFKARWQEQMQVESEISTWMTLWATAILVGIGWLLINKRNLSLADIARDTLSRATILLVPVLSAVFFLGISLKGYEVHQIAGYIDNVLGQRISSITGFPFNDWDIWRRSHYAPLAHGVAYSLLNLFPIAVSVGVLAVYAFYVRPWKDSKLSIHAVYFYVVMLVTITSMATAVWLTMSPT